MNAPLQDVFADTAFWIALIVKNDQYHARASEWSLRVQGRIITSVPVLLETVNALSKPTWRTHAVALMDHLSKRNDIDIQILTPELWSRGWDLYRNRPDKAWSLTDCISFVVMQDAKLVDALT